MAAPANPSTAAAFLFAGQGAQTVGMTKDLLSNPAVAKMYDQAQEILGYDLKEVVLKGPDATLEQTVYAQPALLLADLAAVEKLRATNPAAIDKCQAAAGLSLGEYAALVFAGALSFQDALGIVKVRAENMHSAGQANKGGMTTIVGMEDKDLDAACAAAARATGGVVRIANYLFPKGRVIGGDPAAIAHVKQAVANDEVIVKDVKVSGAFHTAHMLPACQPLRDAIAAVQINMPRIKVYANTTGRPYTSVEEIREQLVAQVVQPVLWDTSIATILRDGSPQLYDLGPRGTIKAMVRRIDATAWKSCMAVDV